MASARDGGAGTEAGVASDTPCRQRKGSGANVMNDDAPGKTLAQGRGGSAKCGGGDLCGYV